MQPILITGSSGRIGQAAAIALQNHGFAVRGLDRTPTPHLKDMVVADLTDADALRHACQGIHTLIHLAATPDDDDFVSQLLPNNLVGAYHILESARSAGAQRFILASTGQVNCYQQLHGPWPVRATDVLTPKGWYAATKMFLEAIGRAYALSHGLSVVIVRLGWCPRTQCQAEELQAHSIGKDIYLSPGDASRFFIAAVTAPPTLQLAVVFASSKPLHRHILDPDPARTLLGFEPQDTWPQGLPFDLPSTKAPAHGSPQSAP